MIYLIFFRLYCCCLEENGTLDIRHLKKIKLSDFFSQTTFHKFFIAFLIWLIGGWPTIVFALPQDGQIVSGTGSISEPTTTSMQVDQNTSQMIVNWQSFNIGQAESVNFTQPSSSSIALNRVIGVDPSLLLGNLTANGQVFIVNGSGVFFGSGSKVDTHGLIATTMAISDQDFLDQNYNFSQEGSLASVINEGTISSTSYVGLLAPAVENRGNIVVASLGSVDLAAGKAATLDFTGDGLINFRVTEAVSGTVTDKDGNVLEDRVSNTGLIQANGGQVRMTAKDAGDVIRHVVNMEGVIEANTVAEEDGWVILGGGDSGVVNVSGTITASGDDVGEEGGTVHVLGEKVGLFDNAVVNVSGDAGGGTALIGGDYQGKNSEVQNASRTYIGENAVVNASAGTIGSGGKVIVWADEVTRFYGSVLATGGSLSGDGGFVEVSGKGSLNFHAHQIALGAVNGVDGTLLLDPTDITISTSADSSTTGFTAGSDDTEAFADDSGTSNFDVTASTGSFAGVTGTIELQATNDITVSAAWNLATSTGNSNVSVVLRAGNDININQAVTLDGTGTLTIEADGNTQNGVGDLIFGASGSFITGGGNVDITANDLNLTSGSINVGTGSVTIVVSDSGSIGLGDTASAMTISGTELQNITASTLTLGDGLGGGIGVDNITAANSNNIGTVTLNATNTGSGVSFSNTASTFNTLNVNGGSGITFNVGVTTDTGALTLDGDQDGDGTGDVNLNSSAALISTNNSLSINANDIGGSGGTINAGTGDVTITVSDAGTISLGLVGTGLSISTTELSNITANNLTIGDNTNDTMTIRGVAAADTDLISGTLTFNATATSKLISIDTTASVFENNVTFNANAGIAVAVNLSTNVGNLVLEGDSDNTTSGAITITGGVTITSAGSLTLDATTGGLTTSGVTTLNAVNGITINDSFTSTATGTVTIDTDTDNNGTGDFTLASGAAMNFVTNTNNVDITANDVTLLGTISNAGARIVFTPSDGGTLGLGDANCGGTCGMTITGTEMQNLTNAGTFVFGDNGTTTTGNIFVDNVTATDTATLTGSTNIQALADNSSVTFTGSKSFFTATVDVDADDGIFINADVEALGSSARFDGDADNSADSSDKIIIADGVTLTSSNVSGGVFLDATTGGIEASGSVTLNAKNGVTINDKFTSTATGTITIDSDTDGASGGDFTIASGTITTNNNNLKVTANSIVVTGNIAAGLGDVTILISDGGAIGIGVAADMTIGGGELLNISATNLIIGDGNNTTITVEGISATDSNNISGIVTLNAGSSSIVAFSTGASTFNAITANGGAGVSISQNLTTDTGGMIFNADSDGTGGGSFTIADSTTITSTNQSIQITADAVTLNTSGAIAAGTGDVTILVSDGGTIGVGSATANLQVNSTELGNIAAANLSIGDSTAGDLTVNAVTLGTNISTLLTLTSGGAVAFNTGASSITNNLAVSATGDITQGVTLSVGGTSSFTVTGTNVATLTQSNTFTGAVSLNSGTGAVSLTDTTATILAASTLGGDLTVTSGGAITDNGTVTVAAAATFDAGTSNNITLDSSANDFGTLAITNGLDVTLIDTNALVLGTSATVTGNLVVTAGGDLTQSGAISVGGTSSITVTGSNVATLTNTSNVFTGAITFSSGTGAVKLTDSSATILAASTLGGNLTVDTSGAMTQTGVLSMGGAATLKSTGDITLSNNVIAIGRLTITADSDGNGVGDLKLNSGVTVDSNNNDLDLQGANIDISSATADAGSGAATFSFSQNTTADGTNVANLTASALTINVTGNLIIDGVTASELSGVSGLVTLKATGDVTFQNNASSSSGAVTIQANNDINVQVDLTSNGNFTAVADNDSSGVGNFTLDSGVTVKASSGNIDISGTQINDNGTLTTSSSGSITKNGVLTQLTESDQSDLDSATDSTFVSDFTSPAESGC